MLASREAAARVRAFDLVLNMYVHAHLPEPMQSEDQPSVEKIKSAFSLDRRVLLINFISRGFSCWRKREDFPGEWKG